MVIFLKECSVKLQYNGEIEKKMLKKFKGSCKKTATTGALKNLIICV